MTFNPSEISKRTLYNLMVNVHKIAELRGFYPIDDTIDDELIKENNFIFHNIISEIYENEINNPKNINERYYNEIYNIIYDGNNNYNYMFGVYENDNKEILIFCIPSYYRGQNTPKAFIDYKIRTDNIKLIIGNGFKYHLNFVFENVSQVKIQEREAMVWSKKELLIFPLDNKKTPKYTILSEEEGEELKKELKLLKNSNLPIIKKSDIIAKIYNLQRNTIVKIEIINPKLNSAVSTSINYRIVR